MDDIFPRDYPYSSCPTCGGWLYVDFVRAWEIRIWELDCIMCGRTCAHWLRGWKYWRPGAVLEMHVEADRRARRWMRDSQAA